MKKYYQLVSEGTKNAMRLQSIGLVRGTPAGEIKVGDCSNVEFWKHRQDCRDRKRN